MASVVLAWTKVEEFTNVDRCKTLVSITSTVLADMDTLGAAYPYATRRTWHVHEWSEVWPAEKISATKLIGSLAEQASYLLMGNTNAQRELRPDQLNGVS